MVITIPETRFTRRVLLAAGGSVVRGKNGADDYRCYGLALICDGTLHACHTWSRRHGLIPYWHRLDYLDGGRLT